MVMIPPRHYCIIANPVVRENGKVAVDAHGCVGGARRPPPVATAADGDSSVRVRHGDEEVRFAQDPFVLYPGEKLFGKVAPLQVVGPNQVRSDEPVTSECDECVCVCARARVCA